MFCFLFVFLFFLSHMFLKSTPLAPQEGSISSDYNAAPDGHQQTQSTTKQRNQYAGDWRLHESFIFPQVPDKCQ